MSTVKVNEVRHLSNSGTANIVLESNADTNLQSTSTLGLTVTGTLTVSGVSTFNGNTIVGNASSDTMLLTSTVSGFNNFSGFTAEIRMYAGNAAGDAPPAGWLYCNGDTISSTSANGGTHYNLDGKGNDYQPLFNKLKESSDWGNTSSASWGTNTVKTPDFRSRSPVGIHTGAATSITAGLTSRTLSDVAGTETHALIIAELAVHTHASTIVERTTGHAVSTVNAEQPNHTHTIDPHPHGDNFSASAAAHSHAAWAAQTSSTGGASFGPGDYAQTGSSGSGPGDYSMIYTLANTSSITVAGGVSNSGILTTNGDGDDAITVSGGVLTGGTHGHTLTPVNAAHSGVSAAGTAHTILSPIIAVNYIIKV